MLSAGEQLEKVCGESGIIRDTNDCLALPEWKPCPSYVNRNEDFDLFVINYKVPIQIHGVGRFNPLLRQLIESHKSDVALIDSATASKKGMRDGNVVWLETKDGSRTQTVMMISERVHPEVIATMQHRLKAGADFNSLVTLDKETLDFVGCTVDMCVLAKCSKSTAPLLQG